MDNEELTGRHAEQAISTKMCKGRNRTEGDLSTTFLRLVNRVCSFI